MRSMLTAAIGSAAVLGMCAVQGCSSGSSSTQAGSGTPTTTGSSAAPGSSSAVSSAPAGGSSSSPASTGSSSSAPAVHASSPVAAHTGVAPAGAPSGTFTAPDASAAVVGWGSYTKINAHLVHVQVCAKKVGNVFAVGVEAIAYNSDYSKQGEIASVILPETPGQQACTQINLFYTAHLKVYSFLGSGGTITKKSPLKTIY